MMRLTSFLVCWLGVVFSSFSQKASFPIWQYTSENGLPSPEVYFIHQDRQGYIWFATDRGVSRFDGYSFQNYGVKEGLEDLVVFQIEEDQKGRLWFLTLSNQLFILENDSIRPYPYNHLLKGRENPALRLSNFYLGKNETLYFSLMAGGFFRFHPEKKFFEPLHQCGGTLVLWDGGEWKGRSFFVGKESGLAYPDKIEFDQFISRRDSFQICIQTAEKQFKIKTAPIPGYTYPYSTNNPKFLWTKQGKNSYLFQLYNTFYFVQDGQIRWTVFDNLEMDCMITASDGAIWMGARSGGGLRRYASLDDIPKGRFQACMPGHSITHLIEGRRGEIWASSLENGIFCIPPSQIESFDERSGLPGTYILDIAVKDSLSVFFTTQNRYLGELDIKAETLSYDLLPGNLNYYIYWDAGKKELWRSSNDIAYQKNGTWSNIPGPYLASKKFTPLHDPPDALALTSPFAFITVSAQTKKTLIANYNDDLAFNDRTLAIHQDRTGKIWLGTLNGLKWLNGRELASPPVSHPAMKIRVNAIAELPDSTLVIGTQGFGLLLWKRDQMVPFTQKNGLSSDIIECLHVDARGQLWVGSRNGLDKLTLSGSRNARIQSFSTLQGLPSNQINTIASAGDHIWVATAKGLAHIVDPQFHPRLDTVQTIPIIQKIVAGEENRALSGPHHFRHDENDLILQFAALDYLQRGHIEYRYRLKQDDNWNYTHTRVLNLPALSPGTYRFEVQAQVFTGMGKSWSPSTILDFRIENPFWKKNWFRAILFLAISGSVGTGVWMIILRIRKKAQMERHLRYLERSALQAQMNPHFVFNALNSIQGFIQRGDKKNASKYLSKFARLMRATLNHSRLERITLTEELTALREYMDLERMRMGERFDFQVELSKEVDPFGITLPPMLIQPFLENAVKHGIGPKEGPGQINLILRADTEYLFVTIRDTGVGYYHSLEEKKKRSQGENQSLGMSITRQRLNLLDPLGEKGNVSIEELKDETGKTLGTEVRFKIRYGA